jgi:hypothetical protein
MLALSLVQWVAAFANLTLAVVVVMIVLWVVVLMIDRVSMSPFDHMLRERRRHAERAAKTMAAISRIRARTIQQMLEAEGGGHRD